LTIVLYWLLTYRRGRAGKTWEEQAARPRVQGEMTQGGLRRRRRRFERGPAGRRRAATGSRTLLEAGEPNRRSTRRTVVALDVRTARSASHRYSCPLRTTATDTKVGGHLVNR